MRKLTFDVVKKILKITNQNIEILSTEYVNAREKLKCKCLIDGHEWDITWDKLYQGRGCPKCRDTKNANGRKLTIEVVREKLLSINPNIEILSLDYFNIHTKLKCKCNIDGHKWYGTWNNLSKGKGCPRCSGVMELTLEEIKTRLRAINPDIEVLGNEYVNSYTKLLCRCSVDGNIWGTEWSNLSGGHGCPECYIKSVSGSGHHNWKGGITPLHIHLRTYILP